MRKSLICLLSIMLIIVCCNFSSTRVGAIETNGNKVGRYVSKYFDEETGIVIYYGIAGVAGIQIKEATTTLQQLTNKSLNRQLFYREVDKQYGVVTYYYSAGPWFATDVTAVKIHETILTTR